MGLPKKGSRRILINETNYRYIITGNDGYIDLIIEQDDCQGQRLTVSFDYHHEKEQKESELGEKYTSLTQTNQITPVVVKQSIEYGIDNGWTPNQKGKEIRINFIDDKVKLNLKTKT
jgi:hypothetical protein